MNSYRYRGTFSAVVLALVTLATVERSALAEPAPSATDDQALARSRESFVRGVAQAERGEWDEARASFSTAYSLYPHASILLNLGIAELRAGDAIAAERDLVRFFSEDRDAPAADLASAREALSEARAKIGTVQVDARPAQVSISVDGERVDVRTSADARGASAVVRVLPGAHLVRIEADGYVPYERSVELEAGQTERLDTALEEREGSTRSGPSVREVVGWSLAGLSAGAFVTSGVAGLRAISLSDAYRDPGSDRFRDSDTRSTGIGFRTTADVALVVGIASGIGAAVLLLTHPGEQPNVRARAPLGLVHW